MLRLEAGRNPHDRKLIELIGELSTQSEVFRKRWASHDLQYHRSGQKRLRHPVVGQLDLKFESRELLSEPGLTLNIYAAPAGSPTADGLTMLASWGPRRNSSRILWTQTPEAPFDLELSSPLHFVERSAAKLAPSSVDVGF